MASSKSFFLLLCALFALVFTVSSEVSTLDARDSNQFGNRTLGCDSPFICCTRRCHTCCCCDAAKDQKRLVIARINNESGINCYDGLQCCHYNSLGKCTACCAAAKFEDARPALEHNKLQTDQESNPANDVEDSELIAMVASDV